MGEVPVDHEKYTAYHEAGHAAADLLFGHKPTYITIKKEGPHLGLAGQLDGDNMTEEGCRRLAVSCYAGLEAEKRVNPDHETAAMTAGRDTEIAALEYLPCAGKTEPQLREEAANLVLEHWQLVEWIASLVWQYETLGFDELEFILDIYQPTSENVTWEDLAEYWECAGSRHWEGKARDCNMQLPLEPIL